MNALTPTPAHPAETDWVVVGTPRPRRPAQRKAADPVTVTVTITANKAEGRPDLSMTLSFEAMDKLRWKVGDRAQLRIKPGQKALLLVAVEDRPKAR